MLHPVLASTSPAAMASGSASPVWVTIKAPAAAPTKIATTAASRRGRLGLLPPTADESADMAVAADDVEAQGGVGRTWRLGKGHAHLAAHGPGADALPREMAELRHAFHVPVQPPACAIAAQADAVAFLIAGDAANIWIGGELGLDRLCRAKLVVEPAIPANSPTSYRMAAARDGTVYIADAASLYAISPYKGVLRLRSLSSPAEALCADGERGVWLITRQETLHVTAGHVAPDRLSDYPIAGSILSPAIDRAEEVLVEGRDRVQGLRSMDDLHLHDELLRMLEKERVFSGRIITMVTKGKRINICPSIVDDVVAILAEAVRNAC